MCHDTQNDEQTLDTVESTPFQQQLGISSVLYPSSGQSILAQLHLVDLVAACWRLGLVFTHVSALQFESTGFVICVLCVLAWCRSTVSQFLNGT